MFTLSKTLNEIGGSHTKLIGSEDITAVIGEKETHSFEIDPIQVENVKQRFLPNNLNYLMLEEYDFRNDTINPDLNVELEASSTTMTISGKKKKSK